MTEKISARVNLEYVVLAIILTTLSGSQARAAAVNLLAPLNGFVLVDPRVEPASDENGNMPTAPRHPRTYGATTPAAAWEIAQWNIPGPVLPPLVPRQEGDVTSYESLTREATVKIVQQAGATSVSLAQAGATLPCTENGRPRESDLFLSPMKEDEAPGHAGVLPAAPRMRLSEMRRLMVVTTVTVQGGPSPVSKGCDASRGNGMIAISLTNKINKQTFFYQLAINQVCSRENKAGYPNCMPWLRRPAFWSRKNPFGVADSLPAMGMPYIRNGERRELNFDVLPRLKETIIHGGPEIMDHNPNDWSFGGTYIGQHIFGDVNLSTKWEGYQLLAEER